MEICQAQLAGGRSNQDQVVLMPNAVAVLDGASAFRPVPVDPGTYAETLGANIFAALKEDQDQDLRTALAHAIRCTAQALQLHPGHSPSATVSIVRVNDTTIDTLVLGDSPIMLPNKTLIDDRLDSLGLPESAAYRERLAHGGGYDDTHRDTLSTLQIKQAQRRNTPGGYWIAEADPAAAAHALTAEHPRGSVPWCILTTDGAYDPLTHLGLDDWPTIATHNDHQLANLLGTCHAWEATTDPTGSHLPRAKRHDDKTLVVLRP
ncbi:hypothetical protein L6E12_26130 [Actinokineospora sp. PR83]|uniref:hypothetical protein n=1 Tax=Actinokineospora sp. PR83 TaxID=2884908 RepID=UPI001F464A6A|nr:hypothetical protein [Actinokineospora sp. PR83]MCG8919258.1 hypothetical protein [Actinokineospora sp. PR83]